MTTIDEMRELFAKHWETHWDADSESTVCDECGAMFDFRADHLAEVAYALLADVWDEGHADGFVEGEEFGSHGQFEAGVNPYRADDN